MMMLDPGVRQQLLTRPKAEMCFRPWWDTIEDSVLVTMLGLGERTQMKAASATLMYNRKRNSNRIKLWVRVKVKGFMNP